MCLKSRIPEFLTEKKFTYFTVVFIIVFSALFMNIYTPFSTTAWFNFHESKQLLAMLTFYVVAFIFLLLSKNVFNEINHIKPMTILSALLYVLGEILALSVFYLVFTILAADGPLECWRIFLRSILCITLILVIPYTITILYGIVKGLNKELMSRENRASNPRLVCMKDNKGKIKLSIMSDSLLYVTSEDNYVKIVYEQTGGISNVMMRTTTKSLEDNFGDELVRCHRSYLVNINKVKLFNNDRENMYIVLDNDLVNPIPVSRSYRDLIESRIAEKK